MDKAINDWMLDNKTFPDHKQTMDFQGGKKAPLPKVKHGCREYAVHEGPRGGKYIIVKKKKVYLR